MAMLNEEQPRRSRANRLFLILGVLGLTAAIAAIAMSFLTEGKPKKRHIVQQIAILRPPPPPPPEREKPPEPEIDEEEVKLPDPDTPPEPQQAEAAPVGQDLGVDAQGTGNGDSFGLVGKPGGKAITEIGGDEGRGDQHRWYAGLIQAEIQKLLSRDKKLRGVEFKAVVSVWLGGEGKLERSELAGSTGNADADEKIKLALAELPPLREKPPADMPQPIRLRVTSRF
ncbi:MAG: energy transducer TonB [Burkholderiales bacterium]